MAEGKPDIPVGTGKLLRLLGAGLLLVAIICGATQIQAIKPFDAGHDVSAGKTYYLLADVHALDAQNCMMLDGNQTNIKDKINTVNLYVDGNDTITNIALPLTGAKGVYADLAFTEDISGAHFSCEIGTNYISRLSPGVLQALWWATVIGLIAGLALIAMSLFMARPKKVEKD